RQFGLQLRVESQLAWKLTHGLLPGFSDAAASGRRRNSAPCFNALEALDLVADLDVVVVLDADAAFGAGLDLGNVVLEAPQRFEDAFVNHGLVAQHADRQVFLHRPLYDQTTGDRAELGAAEDI